jgi:hypothetical protein
MKTKALLALLLLAGALLAGCSTSARPIAPGPDVLKRIGLPMYPRGVTLLTAQEMTMGSRFGATTVVSETFKTTDDFDSVKRYYEHALPQTRREVTMPFAGVKEVTMQVVDQSYQKQVIVMNMQRTGTVVVLQSTNLNLAAPTPDFSSSPSR